MIPSVAYTDPEIAWVGLTETEAQAPAASAYEKGAFPWVASGRSLSLGRDDGFTKLLFDPETHRLLGGGIVGTNAGDLISEVALAIETGRRCGGHRPDHPSAPDPAETVAGPPRPSRARSLTFTSRSGVAPGPDSCWKARRACDCKARQLRSHCPSRGVANASLRSSPVSDRSTSRSKAARDRSDFIRGRVHPVGRTPEADIDARLRGINTPAVLATPDDHAVSAGKSSSSSRPPAADPERRSTERADR